MANGIGSSDSGYVSVRNDTGNREETDTCRNIHEREV